MRASIGPGDGLEFSQSDQRSGGGCRLDWNRGRFVHSARFGYQKMVNAITPDVADSLVFPTAPFNTRRFVRYWTEHCGPAADDSA